MGCLVAKWLKCLTADVGLSGDVWLLGTLPHTRCATDFYR